VIEVGVDVPNASLMVIENAERMGLAQLHQLRGRVGRGAAESTCVLLYRAPLSEVARERLGVMRSTNDGFEISRRDLELRGPGEMLGTRQTGLMQMRVADLVRDADLLPQVQQAAELMLRENEANIAPLLRRWIGQGSDLEKSEPDVNAPQVTTPRPTYTLRDRLRWLKHRLAATALVTEVLPGVAAKAHGYAQLTRLDRPIGIWLLLWPVLWALWLRPKAGPIRTCSSSSCSAWC
jgi:hypothetical protein